MSSREEFLAMLQQYDPDDEDDADGVKKDVQEDHGNEKRCTTTEEGWSKKENKDLTIASPHSASATVQDGNPLSIRRLSDTSTRPDKFSSSSSSSSPLEQQAFPFLPSSAWDGPQNETKNVTRAPKKVGRSLLHAMHQQQEDHLAHHGHTHDGKGARNTEETCPVRHLPSSASSSSPPTSWTSGRAESGGAEAMQRRPEGGKRERDDPALPPSSRRRRGFQTVETYKPLSSGGFLDTTHGSPDRARCMTIGTIVVIVSANASSSSSSTSISATTRTTKDPGGSGETTGHPPSHAALENTPSSSASPTTQSSVLGVVMGKMKHFLPASALTDEEKTYGRFLDAALFESLAQVTRCDTRGRALEVWCLSGKRQKLSVLAVRPAGFMEVQLFQKWKADPSSRPVQHIGDRRLPVHDAPPHPVTSLPSTSGGEENRQDGEASRARDAENQKGRLPTSPSPSSAWWVLPHLIVRVVAKEAGGTWWGQKALVLHIDRKAERMRLVRMEAVLGTSEARASPGVQGAAGEGTTAWSLSSSGYPPEDLLDVFRLGNVETVVPRVGEVGMIVLGQRKGELVVVVRRCRDEKTGDLHCVWVLPQRSAAAYLSGMKEKKDTDGVTGKQMEALDTSSVEEPFEVLPEAICVLHQRHGKNIR